MDQNKLIIGKNYFKHYLVACPLCGKQRYVRIDQMHSPKYSGLCRSCGIQNRPPISDETRRRQSLSHIGKQAGENSGMWRGGRTVDLQGYVSVLLQPNDFFFSMAMKNHYVFEHRLVMARHIGRLLMPWEVVHHKNEERADNRLENLTLYDTLVEHLRDHRERGN